MAKKLAIITLGCKVNQYESSSIGEMFRLRGYNLVSAKDKADIYIINTCTVTNLGDRKSRQLIRRAVKTNPDALIVVTGCYSQIASEEVLKIPGVNLVTGTSDRDKIADLVANLEKNSKVNAVIEVEHFTKYQELPSIASTDRLRAFLKIQEGCDNFCSYCIVPYTRGPLKSRSMENILAEARKLIALGYTELVLTGIHTGAYGRDMPDEISLAKLLEALLKIKGIDRLRLSSVEPMDIDDDLIELLAKGAPLCPHLHLPIQSGDDSILKAMGRNYRSGDILELVGRIRDKVKDISISTDIITGFPGESDDNFLNTLNLIKELKFSFLHVFKYSPRKGTLAADFPGQISSEIKELRSSELIALGQELSLNFRKKYLGREVLVLVEDSCESGPAMAKGYTANYLSVSMPGEDDLRGKIVRVNIDSLSEDLLSGTIIV
ncbi:MAG: tRNA (N(6)-L-threonylcarbamoyladenosine(37)-C(2))-methylthiotransferase MtaB [Peptococcaceae bacterium]|nr:tRNA (N(6)-L-threonylcarbamoyladenosine(37)-C(2))-methylthiotransferase MtaB [Peptococcaceae bacterium]